LAPDWPYTFSFDVFNAAGSGDVVGKVEISLPSKLRKAIR
jgi:hypothetical protein